MDPGTILANWNGKEMALSDVRVSVLDRAFLFGDAVYEVIRLYRGHLFKLTDHMERLRHSLETMKIMGTESPLLALRLIETAKHSGISEGLAYLQISRGEAMRMHRYPEGATPNVLMFVTEFDDPYVHNRERGVAAVTFNDIRWQRNDVKVTSLAANCMAAQYAYEHNCADVLFIDANDFVTEGSHTSVFAVRNGTLLVAPSSTHVLPGITKAIALELAGLACIPVTEGYLKRTDIWAVDELFFSGTPEEILPIVRVDDRAIGDGKPGPITIKLHSEFRKMVDRSLDSEIRSCHTEESIS